MDPGALIPDVGLLEEILVETAVSDRLLKEGLMGAGRTRGHHDPVEAVLPMMLTSLS